MIFRGFSAFLAFLDILLGESSGAESNEENKKYEMPEWISKNPAYLNPIMVDSTEEGFGTISIKESVNRGWVVELNSQLGHGIDIYLEELHLGTGEDDYVVLCGWPFTSGKFADVRLFTGTFTRRQKFRILNWKKFFVLFNGGQSEVPPKMVLTYKRYGRAFLSSPPTTQEPVKRETVFEVYLKGMRRENYSDVEFSKKVKEAIRITARSYCQWNQIRFNDSIATDDMVIFHKISDCPEEWPEGDVCVLLEHSVFVSGERENFDDLIILNYELTSEHLEEMWIRDRLPEIEKLGLEVFKAPDSSGAIALWTALTALIITSSLIMILIFWKIDSLTKDSRKSISNSTEFKVLKSKIKKRTRKVADSEDISPEEKFSSGKTGEKFHAEDMPSGSSMENQRKETRSKQSPDEPLKNYFGSIVFFSNRAYDDDDDDEVEEIN